MLPGLRLAPRVLFVIAAPENNAMEPLFLSFLFSLAALSVVQADEPTGETRQTAPLAVFEKTRRPHSPAGP